MKIPLLRRRQNVRIEVCSQVTLKLLCSTIGWRKQSEWGNEFQTVGPAEGKVGVPSVLRWTGGIQTTQLTTSDWSQMTTTGDVENGNTAMIVDKFTFLQRDALRLYYGKSSVCPSVCLWSGIPSYSFEYFENDYAQTVLGSSLLAGNEAQPTCSKESSRNSKWNRSWGR